MAKAAPPAAGSGGGTEESSLLAAEYSERSLTRFGTGDPVDGVFEESRVRAIVFGRHDDECVMVANEFLEGFGSLRQPRLGFQVAVVKRHRVIAQVGPSDVEAGGPQCRGGGQRQFTIQGVLTNASGDHQNARFHLFLYLKIFDVERARKDASNAVVYTPLGKYLFTS